MTDLLLILSEGSYPVTFLGVLAFRLVSLAGRMPSPWPPPIRWEGANTCQKPTLASERWFLASSGLRRFRFGDGRGLWGMGGAPCSGLRRGAERLSGHVTRAVGTRRAHLRWDAPAHRHGLAVSTYPLALSLARKGEIEQEKHSLAASGQAVFLLRPLQLGIALLAPLAAGYWAVRASPVSCTFRPFPVLERGRPHPLSPPLRRRRGGGAECRAAFAPSPLVGEGWGQDRAGPEHYSRERGLGGTCPPLDSEALRGMTVWVQAAGEDGVGAGHDLPADHPPSPCPVWLCPQRQVMAGAVHGPISNGFLGLSGPIHSVGFTPHPFEGLRAGSNLPPSRFEDSPTSPISSGSSTSGSATGGKGLWGWLHEPHMVVFFALRAITIALQGGLL